MRGRMDDRSMRHKLKPLLSTLLTIAMILSLLPTAVFAAGETGTFTKITTQEELTDGSYILVANTSAGSKALGTNIGSKIDGIDITIDGTTVSSESAIPLWNAIVSEGTIILSNGANYLGYGSSGTNFTKPDEPYTWNIKDNGDATFRFTASTADTRAIAWQDNGARFGAYSTTNTDGYVFDLSLYKADSEPSPDPGGDTDPQPGEIPIKAGDSVVFYMPAENKVMTTTASGSKLAGQEGTLENGTLTTTKEAAIFTVATNE